MHKQLFEETDDSYYKQFQSGSQSSSGKKTDNARSMYDELFEEVSNDINEVIGK